MVTADGRSTAGPGQSGPRHQPGGPHQPAQAAGGGPHQPAQAAGGGAGDPVRSRRARIARLVSAGQVGGYTLFLVAVAVFVVGAVTEFPRWTVTVVVASLAAGSAVLAPAIVIGYGVRAAEREDRARSGRST
jgi:hypothetical protein